MAFARLSVVRVSSSKSASTTTHQPIRVTAPILNTTATISPIYTSLVAPTRVQSFHSFNRWRDEAKSENGKQPETQQQKSESPQDAQQTKQAQDTKEQQKDPKDEKIKQLEEEAKDWKSKYIYSIAEQENIRKIAKQESEKSVKVCCCCCNKCLHIILVLVSSTSYMSLDMYSLFYLLSFLHPSILRD